MKVFTSKLIERTLNKQELKDLVEDFRYYKSEGGTPDSFGRDVPYDHPYTYPPVKEEDISHLQLVDPSKVPVRTLQFYRTSDHHLVYCSGTQNDDYFLLIDILGPEAHGKARRNSIMSTIAAQASRFRDQY